MLCVEHQEILMSEGIEECKSSFPTCPDRRRFDLRDPNQISSSGSGSGKYFTRSKGSLMHHPQSFGSPSQSRILDSPRHGLSYGSPALSVSPQCHCTGVISERPSSIDVSETTHSLGCAFHLQSYDNHLHRLSTNDITDEDEYGHYEINDHLEDLLVKHGGLSNSLLSIASSSGVYLEEDDEHTEEDIDDNDRLKERTCRQLSSKSSQSKSVTPIAIDSKVHSSVLRDAAHSEKLNVSDPVADTNCYYGYVAEDNSVDMIDDESETSLLVSCVIENRKAPLFCRSFAEHFNDVVINTPVCLGICGLRVVQGPYCRIYRFVEYKIKIKINHQSYFVWKRFEDLAKLAGSVHRLSKHYESYTTYSAEFGHFPSSSSAVSPHVVNTESNQKSHIATNDGSHHTGLTCCPATNDSQPNLSFSNSLQVNATGPAPPHNTGTVTSTASTSISVIGLASAAQFRCTRRAWQRVEKHRPWWWFQPRSMTQFGQEESQLLEEFLKHLLFETPNMQLICELIL